MHRIVKALTKIDGFNQLVNEKKKNNEKKKASLTSFLSENNGKLKVFILFILHYLTFN